MATAAASIQVLQLATSFWVSQAVYAAIKLQILDALAAQPLDPAAIAGRCGLHERSTFRLLRALATCGVVTEDAERRFALTSVGQTLCTGSAGSMADLVISLCEAPYRAWHDVAYSVRTGRPAFDHVHGTSFFSYLESHPEAHEAFINAMTAQASFAYAAVPAAYDFSQCRQIVDVGGGRGHLLEAMLRRYPAAQGVLFDRPAVIARVADEWASSDLGTRCTLVSGDMFHSVPAGNDLLVLALVLHDWDDDACLRILRNCRRAVNPGGAVLIVETTLPAANVPSFGKWLDLHMLVCFGGRERAADEYANLVEQAGFRCEHAGGIGARTSGLLLVVGRADSSGERRVVRRRRRASASDRDGKPSRTRSAQ